MPPDTINQESPHKQIYNTKTVDVAPTSIILNQASTAELERLPGIGEVMSKRIISYREQRGRFRALDELMNVAGIGQKKYEKLRPYLRLD
jgi:competence protein ComEA